MMALGSSCGRRGRTVIDTLSAEISDRVVYDLRQGVSLAKALQSACATAVSRRAKLQGMNYGFGWVDSHAVAQAVFNVRASMPEYYQPILVELKDGSGQTAYKVQMGHTITADIDQTRDYVQHCFREMRYGCRYADGHHYMVHDMPECGKLCRERRSQRVAARQAMFDRRSGPVCSICNITIPLTGICDWCGEDFNKVPGQTP